MGAGSGGGVKGEELAGSLASGSFAYQRSGAGVIHCELIKFLESALPSINAGKANLTLLFN